MVSRRARSLGETFRLARAASARAGVTRLADIGGLAGFGLPVFQAIRPHARSLTVSQGKGASPLAAKVSALLEAAELACAEALPRPASEVPLDKLPATVRRCWSGDRPPLAIDLDPARPRGWVEGEILGTQESMPMPWDLLSLDFTLRPLEFPATSDGLATGNTREEAVLAALCELVEHDSAARLEELNPRQRRLLQIDTRSIDNPLLARELGQVRAAGFTPRLWSIGRHGIPAVSCVLFAPEPALDLMVPTSGSACHPDPALAALAALREAVQARAALVAGSRDDLTRAHYASGRRRARALALATLGVAEGVLPWSAVPSPYWTSPSEGIALLRQAIARITALPVVVFDHPAPVRGLHVVHALAPGLRNLARGGTAAPAPPPIARRKVSKRRPREGRAILFAGPSIAGLEIPAAIELRPPAVCGDLAALLRDPPAAVGLVDGHFGTAPTVWHKEILELLAQGVRVLGAASIGALRAAELAEAGMEGIGAIYAAYRAGAIERDDAVMLLQAPAEFAFAPLTLALVDAEYALTRVSCAPEELRMMQRIVRTMRYELRSWERCLEAYRSRTGRVFPVPRDALERASSLKREDAALLIDRLGVAARMPGAPPHPGPPPLTNHYLRMRTRIRAAAAPVPA